MDVSERERLEQQIRERFDAGDLHGAATLGIRGYGPEIFGVLVSLQRDESLAHEAFSAFAERLWRGLPAFEWQCSFRTWAYTIARNASRNLADATRVRKRVTPLPSDSELEAVAAEVRSTTQSFLKSRVKDGLAKLREALPSDDQLLLVLRFDKEMSWNEIARVMSTAEAALDAATEKREAARLRQRGQTLKRELLAKAKAAGLVGDGSNR